MGNNTSTDCRGGWYNDAPDQNVVLRHACFTGDRDAPIELRTELPWWMTSLIRQRIRAWYAMTGERKDIQLAQTRLTERIQHTLAGIKPIPAMDVSFR